MKGEISCCVLKELQFISWNRLSSEPKMCHKQFLGKKSAGAVRARV